MMQLAAILDRLPLRKPVGVPGSAIPAILVGLFVSLGGVLFGYDTGNINGIVAMQQWKNHYSTGYTNATTGKPDITASQKALVVSILSAGTFFGALIAAPAADKIGRRWGLIASCNVFIVGVVLQVASESMALFVVGRAVAGFGVGMLSTLIPLYQSETAPKWIRGFIIGAYQLSITIGLLLAAIVDNATKNRADSGSYRIPLSVQVGWSLGLILGMLALPETPRYLIKRNRPQAAARSLAKLRRLPLNSPHLAEIAEIAQHHERELNLGGTSYLDCFKGNIGKRLLTGCLLQALQQLTGVNFIFYYSSSFFENNDMGNAFTVTLLTNIVNVVSTIPGLWMVEKWGRRPLLLFGAIGMAISQIIVATIGTTLSGRDSADKASLAFVCIYIFFFACSWGPTVWVVPGEIFTLKIRAKAMSISTATNWLVNWGLAYAIPYMIDSGKGNLNLQSKIFYIWAGCCAVACVVVWSLVYETKGLSLEQVDELYGSINKAWNSHYFVPEPPSHAVRPRPWSGRSRYSEQKSPTPTYQCHIEAVNSPRDNADDDDDFEGKVERQPRSPQSHSSTGTFYFDFDRPARTQPFT
ncbi:putative xylose transporter [Talaromyces proteolyticus]|uniref:Xylose transporter n=1 Tax=Talaromyces proteolyticus TaxID=1131652 RepID=A0AAD4PZ36_9EURO|nr:putative xylose transporter [Talaromyces proteolyticus]KAH8695264.1 putative xylose transporter [Talaromyces proteolyticus]